MMSFKWFYPSLNGGCWAIAEFYDSAWHVNVTDVRSLPVIDEELRRAVIERAHAELSSLRLHLWNNELGNSKK